MEVESRGRSDAALMTQEGALAATSSSAAGPYIQGPVVGNLSVSDKSSVHLGPKVYKVTQHVTHKEVVREVSCPKYVLAAVRSASRAELASCAAALALLVGCTLIILYVALWAHRSDKILDKAPHEWNITRDMWLARPREANDLIPERYSPVRLVVVQHSVSSECHRFIACAAELRNLQSYFIDKLRYGDIPYNFLIGNEGRVYEGRGWGFIGTHTLKYNICSIGIGFIGDYRPVTINTRVTEAMVNNTQRLLDYGVAQGYLHPDYVIMPAWALTATASPGQNVYNVISTWKHFSKNKYTGMTCDQINGIINQRTHSPLLFEAEKH